MASTRDVLACTTKEYSETLSRSESLRVPRREGSVNVTRAQRRLHSSQQQHKTNTTHKGWRSVTMSPWTS